MYSQIHTFAECRLCILKMLERYSSNGILNSCGEIKDIEKRLVDSINIHARKLYAQFFRKTERVTLNFQSDETADFTDTDTESDEALLMNCCTAALPENFAKIRAVYDGKGFPVPLESFEISVSDGTVKTGVGNSGIYIFEYYIYPERLTEDCSDDAQIILPPILFDALCYMCASDLCPSSDGELFSKLTYKYREILENYYDGARSLSHGRNSFFKVSGTIGRKKSVLNCTRTKKVES